MQHILQTKAIWKTYGGFFDIQTKKVYVHSKQNLTPEQLKEAVLNVDIDQLTDMNMLGVICHETLHALSAKEHCGFQKYENHVKIGIAINEGMTQFLTEKMVPSTYKTYEKEVETTRYLLAIFGDDMIDAYLNEDFDSVLNMVAEKQAANEFMKLITLSDCRVYKYMDREDTSDLDRDIDRAIVDFINVVGIDISKFIENDLPIPLGINKDVFVTAIKEYIDKGGSVEKILENVDKGVISKCFDAGIMDIIDQKNNGEISLEEYIKMRSCK